MSKEQWQVVSDVRGFLADKGSKRTREHAFTKKVVHWSYCAQCGLVQLRNDVSRKAAKAKCVTYE